METNVNATCEKCAMHKGTPPNNCVAFREYTTQIQEIWDRFNLGIYPNICTREKATQTDSITTILITIQLLDDSMDLLRRVTGTEPWLDAIEAFEGEIKSLNEGASDSCFGCGITIHTDESEESIQEYNITESTIHLYLNIFH